MEQLLRFLQSIHPLSVELQEHMQQILKPRELKRKEFLLKAGHVCREICFVDSGLLRCYYSQKGNETSSCFMKEGDLVVSIESFYRQQESYESI